MFGESSATSVKGLETRRALRRPGDKYRQGGKRLLDIVLVSPAIPLALLVIAFVAIVMRLSGDRGPVLFGHPRIGRNGKAFRCWKIRSMVPDAENRLRAHLAKNPAAAEEWKRDQKLADDPRITRMGQFLRKSSLDELPQLWNVLRGDMSLVGPRPIVRTEVRKYGPHRFPYFSVRPGVTGLWQISGRNDISYRERVQLDVAYINRMSLWTDLRVILGTFGAVLGRTGK